MRKFTRSGRGFTLVETIFSALVLALLLGVLAALFIHGLRAHSKGELSRKAQALNRDTLDKITTELRSASIVASVPQPSGTVPVSAVIWPDPYEEASWGADFGGIYTREAKPPDATSDVPYSLTKNRLIFTRPGTSVDSPSLDLTNQSVYVEYLVTPDRRNLLRKVHRLVPANEVGGGLPRGHSLNVGTNRYVIDESYFEDDTGLVGGAQPVVALTGEGDSIEFEVVQPQQKDYLGNDTQFYEPDLFKITCRIALTERDFVSRSEMTSQVSMSSRD